MELDQDQVHEDEAAFVLARALAGPGVTFTGRPKEGKLQLEAAWDGLFKVKVEPLVRFNLLPEMMCATIHTYTPVKAGQRLAGTRIIIPLIIHRTPWRRPGAWPRSTIPSSRSRSIRPRRAALIITGNGVYDGLIEDRFAPIMRKKLSAYGSSLMEPLILPDDAGRIAEAITALLNRGADLIITTGGMSVDPDDVTRLAISRAGVEQLYYGAGALPGSHVSPGLPRPGAHYGRTGHRALYHEATIVDLILPRLLPGEQPDRHDLARLAHGGLCCDCHPCRFPACPFGK